MNIGDYTRNVESGAGVVAIESPIRTNESGANNLWLAPENDFLRLWINLSSLGEPEPAGPDGIDGTFQTYILSVSVSSNLGKYILKAEDASEVQDEEENARTVGSIELLPISEKKCYTQSSYNPTDQKIYDAGNITKSDREFWLETIGDILQRQQS